MNMDSNRCSPPQEIPRKRPVPESIIPPRCSPVLGARPRFLAHKLGAISRTRIEKEVSKGDPRLRRLVGHASVFDHVTGFIMTHISNEAEDVERSGSAASVTRCNHRDSDEHPSEHSNDPRRPVGPHSPCQRYNGDHNTSFNHYKQFKPEATDNVVVKTTEIESTEIDSTEMESTESPFFDSDSDTATDVSEDGSWEEEQSDLDDTDYEYDSDDGQEWLFEDLYVTKDVQERKTEYLSRCDDLQIEAQ